ncbi:MAG: hypothetical protein GXO74_13950 [Calditrichaeota bacterium]|nr:hypothetical protein [Calditrichota bacterium]
MMETVLIFAIVSILGGIAAVDAVPAFQFMINRPIVICSLTGAIFGMTEVGVTFGILFELPWLIDMPLGGKHGSENSLGAVVAAGLAIVFFRQKLNQDNIIIIINFLFGMGIAKIGANFIEFVRQKNLSLVQKADLAIQRGEFSQITVLNLTGAAHSFVMGLALTAAGLISGYLVLPVIIKFIHPNFNDAFGMAKFGILGVGFGSVLTLFLTNKETKRCYLVPTFIGVGLWLLFF